LSKIGIRALARATIRAACLLANIARHEYVLQSLVKYASRRGDRCRSESPSLSRVDLGLFDEAQHLMMVRIRLKPLGGSPVDLCERR